MSWNLLWDIWQYVLSPPLLIFWGTRTLIKLSREWRTTDPFMLFIYSVNVLMLPLGLFAAGFELWYLL